jgi:HSP20 family protein
MMNTMRWSPFAPMFQLRREIDDLFGRVAGQPYGGSERVQREWTWTPAVEGKHEDGKFVIRVALPGVDPKDVEVSVLENELVVKGQRHAENEAEGAHYFARELSYGAFERRFTLPEGVDANKVTAKFNHGLLEITVPEPVTLMPKKVNVEIQGQPRAAVEAAA